MGRVYLLGSLKVEDGPAAFLGVLGAHLRRRWSEDAATLGPRFNGIRTIAAILPSIGIRVASLHSNYLRKACARTIIEYNNPPGLAGYRHHMQQAEPHMFSPMCQ